MFDDEYCAACRHNITLIKEKLSGRDLWIYGYGHGGRLAYEVFVGEGLPVRGFVDRNAEYLNNSILPVKK